MNGLLALFQKLYASAGRQQLPYPAATSVTSNVPRNLPGRSIACSFQCRRLLGHRASMKMEDTNWVRQNHSRNIYQFKKTNPKIMHSLA